MHINKSGALYSSIVGVTEQLKKLQQQTGEEYLLLNRGINTVETIDLNAVIPNIDFNSPGQQFYAPNSGKEELRDAINTEYFADKTSTDNIIITGGGMNALDLTIQTIDIENIFFAKYFWAAYPNVIKMRGKTPAIYENFEWLYNNPNKIKGQAVIICDPNNPVGHKVPDETILELVKFLNDNGTIVLYDSPYRRIFHDVNDTLYQQFLNLENVIIIESFSKSIGLSGQRLGFVHCNVPEFRKEFNIRLLYETNSINAFAQSLVYNLLATPEGKNAVKNFKENTTAAIAKNIRFLRENNLLAEGFYQEVEPMGIFVVLNMSQDELLKYNIGSVSMKHFTIMEEKKADKYARVCVSVSHDKLKRFFNAMLH